MSSRITTEHKVGGTTYPLVQWMELQELIDLMGHVGILELVNKAVTPVYRKLIKKAVEEGKSREEIIGLQLAWVPPPPKVKKRAVGKTGVRRQELLDSIYNEAMQESGNPNYPPA